MTMRRISKRSYPQFAPKDILLIPSIIEILEKNIGAASSI